MTSTATRLVLVRHGEAAAGWNAARDPGLSPLGHEQARRAAAALGDEAGDDGPFQLVTSPLRRARETAAPLERAWRCTARIDPAVGEISSPVSALAGRAAWLRELMSSHWADLDPDLRSWRRSVIEALCALDRPTVVFTHFIAVNVAVGAATGQDPVVCFAPDNASRTIVDVIDGRLHLIARGCGVAGGGIEPGASAASEPMVQ